MRRKRRLALAWCCAALAACLAIVLVGARILVVEDVGEAFLAGREAEWHTKGTYRDTRIPEMICTMTAQG